ncbi:MAG: heme exporter protein CcmB [Hyphomicrobiaceae bacterium]|jgi:heme exporter protein B
MKPFLALLRRDLELAVREGSAVGAALGFFLIVVAVMPLGLGPDLNLLSRIAPGVLWIALMLAALLSVGRIFEVDAEDGSLEVLATGSLPLEIVAVAKSLAHWLTTALPLTLLTPALGLLLNLDIGAYPMLLASLIVGTPAVSFLGATCAALTLKSHRGGLLLALLALPLYIPTLIFGISTINAALTAPAALGASFLLLLAISLVSIVIAPVATAAVLRLQLQ